MQLRDCWLVNRTQFKARHELCKRSDRTRLHIFKQRRGSAVAAEHWVNIAVANHGVDHANQPKFLAILWREDPSYSVGVQFGNLVRGNHAASAAVDTHMRRAFLGKTVNQVLEILDVTALIGANCDSLHILLDGSGHKFINGAVMTQMDHLGALRLQNATHDVDRHVMAIKQARCGDKTNWVHGQM
ncbi:unannotated protein [freshwater metagenome]|uniref:Unannotated protein n=1 Tax=freshwater metagenome TaxID=449393 RepID=A0A6J6URT9_9ZZZZ